MAYNTPGYIDVTQSSPLRQDELPIMTSSSTEEESGPRRHRGPSSPRYPYSIVWTPIPILTWLFPFIGHMGICTSNGVIRDFAGSYYVSEDNMAFGNPTRYVQLRPEGPAHVWDAAVNDAACAYKTKIHSLCWNNCHSMVAMALNNMKYKNKSWNSWKLGFWLFFCGKFVGVSGFLKTYLPFIILVIVVAFTVIYMN